jgi:tRNA (guanine37-N1)-methyltransferase
VKVHVLTLFPRLFDNFLKESIVGIAQEKGHLQVQLTDWRTYTTDRHHSVDDRPFGGGPGMVIKPEPVFDAVEDVLAQSGRPSMPRILLTPQGRPFDQATAEWLATEPEWLLLCGRYEGFDERIHEGFDWIELSLGSFVLSGGEIPAMAVIEAATRLIPGVLGEPQSAVQESFAGELLDHPQYTRPRSFRGMDVPSVLLNGDHDEIAAWRRDQAERRTAAWRSSRNPRT